MMFCHEYGKTGNATTSAIHAGYSAKTAKVQGCTLLTRPNVIEQLSIIRERIDTASDITAERILTALWKNHETAESSGQLQHSNRALELLGKANRLFIDRVEQTVTIYEEMSDAELDTAIKQAQTEIDKHIH